jgi:hypothetical protein
MASPAPSISSKSSVGRTLMKIHSVSMVPPRLDRTARWGDTNVLSHGRNKDMKTGCSVIAASLVAAILPIASVASAQQSEACRTAAKSMSALAFSTVDAEKPIGRLGDAIDQIMPHISGQLRMSAKEFKEAQGDLLLALKNFRIKAEDFTYQLQICAR